MALTGNQPAITPARAGILRSAAGRSGWPLTIGSKVPLYALSNIARSAATRANYHGPGGFIAIGGDQIGTGPTTPGAKVIGNLTIVDALNEAPNRAMFRVKGMIPKIGQDVVVTLGSKNSLERLFAGQILNFTHAYIGTPALYVFDVNAIDWTWGLHQRILSKRWTNTSATTIAADIVALGAPGYTTDYVAVNLAALNEFTVTDLTVPAALSQLANRIGGYWYVDYFKRLHLWTDADPEPLTDPAILNPVHPTLFDLTIDTDGGQLVTRVYVEGGGSTTMGDVRIGETLIPIVSPGWYEAGGGFVKSGPQKIQYGRVSSGGGGALVGPGASPSAKPNGVVVGGAGVTAGVHDWAVSFVTATGESLTGPRLTLTVGFVSPPATAPSYGGTQAGAGPNPGWHYWAVTFVTASGETVIGPSLVATVPEGPVPLAAPTAGTPQIGGSIDLGSYAYAVTFGTASGESTPGPVGNWVTLSQQGIDNAGAPFTVSNGPNNGQGNLTLGDFYDYAMAYSSAASSSDHSHETAVVSATSPVMALDSNLGGGKSSTITVRLVHSSSSMAKWVHLYRRNYTKQGHNASDFRWHSAYPAVQNGGQFDIADHTADSIVLASTPPSPTNTSTSSTNAIPLTDIPQGGSGVIRRTVYRTYSGGGLSRVVVINNNSTTTYLDTASNASLGPGPPSVNLAGSPQVILNNIPTGGPDVIARRIYRTPAYQQAASELRFVTSLGDNTTKTVVDSVSDAALGAVAPAVSTALANRVDLSAIPIGGSGVTSRRLYRTPAGGGTLRLLATIADNATTVYTDQAADGALGAAHSGTDLSGLTQPAGNVPAGSTSIIVAGAGAFLPTGGWAVIGNGQQVIRYTGLTGNALIGVPASGAGAIEASIAYNSTITPAPMLMDVPASGAGSIVYALRKGDDVNLWIPVDDIPAQQLVALLFTSAAGGVHSGIIEDVIQDRRLSATEARARGRAHLTQRRDVQLKIKYRSRDINTRAGRSVTVNLLAPPYSLSATFTIQSVTIHEFTPSLFPIYDVEASSVRFSFEDLLRRIGTRTDPTG